MLINPNLMFSNINLFSFTLFTYNHDGAGSFKRKEFV